MISINTKIIKRPLLMACGLLLLLLTTATLPVQAQRRGGAALEFKPGSRILFLGSSLFENEIAKGYLEYALATRWPDRELTFRNLGWTGDNVFAEARSTFTTPPTPYQQLFQQIRSTHPNYVLIAYGGVESQKGEAGVGEFVKGLGAILDSVDALGAQSILLSTIPVKLAGNPENTIAQNKNLRLYADAIAAVASKRKKRFVDIYTPIAENTNTLFLANGIHLNEAGYRYLAQVLEQAFGWPSRGVNVTLTAGESTATGPAKIVSSAPDKLVFSLEEPVLPLPVIAGKSDGTAAASLQVNGLKKGRYTLTENGRNVITASEADWAKGVVLDRETSK